MIEGAAAPFFVLVNLKGIFGRDVKDKKINYI